MDFLLLMKPKMVKKIKEAPNFMAALAELDKSDITFNMVTARRILMAIRQPERHSKIATVKDANRFRKEERAMIVYRLPMEFEDPEEVIGHGA